MKTARKRYTGEFKAKVALEAIEGDVTLAELAAKHGINPTMIATWRRQAIEGMAAIFRGAVKRPRPRVTPRLRTAREDRPVGGGTGLFVEGFAR